VRLTDRYPTFRVYAMGDRCFSSSSTADQRTLCALPEDQLSYELGSKVVQELPPLYTRLLVGSIGLLILGAIAWAHFSMVDEVAVATGELIASTQVRPVRALGGGNIRAIKVKEGDRIVKGQVLIERNPDLPQAEVDRLAKSSQLIQEDLKCLEAERTGSKTAETNLQDQLIISRLKDFKARQASATAEANRQIAVINEAKVTLTRLQENFTNAKTNFTNAQSILVQGKSTLTNAQKREEGLRILLSSGATPRLDYLEAQSRVINAQADITRSEDSLRSIKCSCNFGSVTCALSNSCLKLEVTSL